MKKVFAVATLLVILASGICQSAAVTAPSSEWNFMSAPINDLCANATLISGFPYTLTGYDATDATTSVDDPEPEVVSAPVFSTMWWKWIADSDALVTLDSTGTNFDNALSVWAGTCGSFTEVTSDWGGPGGSLNTVVSFRPTIGVTYYFMASTGDTAAVGTMTLDLAVSNTGLAEYFDDFERYTPNSTDYLFVGGYPELNTLTNVNSGQGTSGSQACSADLHGTSHNQLLCGRAFLNFVPPYGTAEWDAITFVSPSGGGFVDFQMDIESNPSAGIGTAPFGSVSKAFGINRVSSYPNIGYRAYVISGGVFSVNDPILTLDLGIYHHYKLAWRLDATNGALRFYVDGVKVYERTGIAILTDEGVKWSQFEIGCTGAIDNIRFRPDNDFGVTPPPAPPLPPTPAPAVAVPSAAPIACNPTVQLQNGGRGKFGCNIGGVGWSPTFTSSPGSVPIHPDPVEGELLSGKDCDAWVEVDVQT